MFTNMGVHVIEFPSGRFGFVGSLPPVLGYTAPATTADIMAGRAYTSKPDGAVVTIKFPSFTTKADAVAHATALGVTVKS